MGSKHLTVIPEFRKGRQEDCEFKAILGYLGRLVKLENKITTDLRLINLSLVILYFNW